mgnify:FL=1
MSKPKSFNLADLEKILDATLVGDPDRVVDNIATISNSNDTSISFITNNKYKQYLSDSKAAAVIVSNEFDITLDGNYLKCDDPYLAYAKLTHLFKSDDYDFPYIHPSAVISEDSEIDENVYIGPNVFIGPNCIIKGNVKINANCSVVKNVTIDEDTLIHHGSVLGSDGFGFAPSKDGYTKIEQLGGLKIGKKVEIGANCTLDRGALDDTVIGDGVIFDNQIHIAHNVVIGKNSAIAASCAIAGSSVIGENFQMGGLSGVLGHLKICDNVKVGAHTLITKNIDEPGEYIGIMPAQEHKAWAKSSVYIKNKGK